MRNPFGKMRDSIVVSLPGTVAAFFGMNVALPGEGHPLAFIAVFAIALFMTAVATFIFYKRDWF